MNSLIRSPTDMGAKAPNPMPTDRPWPTPPPPPPAKRGYQPTGEQVDLSTLKSPRGDMAIDAGTGFTSPEVTNPPSRKGVLGIRPLGPPPPKPPSFSSSPSRGEVALESLPSAGTIYNGMLVETVSVDVGYDDMPTVNIKYRGLPGLGPDGVRLYPDWVPPNETQRPSVVEPSYVMNLGGDWGNPFAGFSILGIWRAIGDWFSRRLVLRGAA